MKNPRRSFLHLAAAAVALPAISRFARAQTYPARPVHIILGFPAGGSSDVIGRVVAQWLSERLGQPFVFDNRPGAGSNIGTEMVVRAAPDGYTLLWTTSANAINATLYDSLSFNFVRDIAPIAGVFRVPNIMEVHPSVPAKTVPEVIAYAKANPGKINMASGGIGTTAHVAGELFKMMTGVDMRHVPYRGSAPALIDLLGGHVALIDYVAVEDVGRIINPLTLHGQCVGAIVQGLGGTLLEHFIYDADGQLLTGSLVDYLLPTSSYFPNIRAVALELKPSPNNPLGAKGAGEGGIIPVGGVIANAVTAALTSFGVQTNELPLSPSRVWQMIQAPRQILDKS